MEHYFLIGMGSFCFATLLNAFLYKKYQNQFQRFQKSEGFKSFKRYRMGISIVTAILWYAVAYGLFPNRPLPIILLDVAFFVVVADVILLHLLFFFKAESLDISRSFFWKIIISRYSFYLSFVCLYFSFDFYRPTLS